MYVCVCGEDCSWQSQKRTVGSGVPVVAATAVVSAGVGVGVGEGVGIVGSGVVGSGVVGVGVVGAGVVGVGRLVGVPELDALPLMAPVA